MNLRETGSLPEALINGLSRTGSKFALPIVVAVDDAEYENAVDLNPVDDQIVLNDLNTGRRVHLGSLAVGERKLRNPDKSPFELLEKLVGLG